jgi:hypothetical protein
MITMMKRSTKGPPRTLGRKKKGDSLSEGTNLAEDKTKPDKKRKQVDHLEGEFKKIKPTTFDGESKIGEEDEAWLLDIKKILPNLQLF